MYWVVSIRAQQHILQSYNIIHGWNTGYRWLWMYILYSMREEFGHDIIPFPCVVHNILRQTNEHTVAFRASDRSWCFPKPNYVRVFPKPNYISGRKPRRRTSPMCKKDMAASAALSLPIRGRVWRACGCLCQSEAEPGARVAAGRPRPAAMGPIAADTLRCLSFCLQRPHAR